MPRHQHLLSNHDYGFETTLLTTGDDIDVDDYAFVKESMDKLNKRVNPDLPLLMAARDKREVVVSVHF